MSPGSPPRHPRIDPAGSVTAGCLLPRYGRAASGARSSMPGVRPRQPWLRVRCGAGKSPRSFDDEAADVGMPAAVRRELPGQWRCCSLRPRRQPPRGPRRFDGRYQRTAWSRRQARGAGSVVLPLHDATPDASGSGERQEDENRGDRAQDGCPGTAIGVRGQGARSTPRGRPGRREASGSAGTSP